VKRSILFVLVAGGLTFNAWTGIRMGRIGSWGLVALSLLFSLVLLGILASKLRATKSPSRRWPV